MEGEHRLRRLAGRHVAAEETIGERLERCGTGLQKHLAGRAGRFGQHLVVDAVENARQRHTPALVAWADRGIKRCTLHEASLADLRRTRQRTRWQARQCLVLRLHQRRDQVKKPLEIVARRQRLETGGAALKDRRQVGQANALPLGGGAEDVFAVGRRGIFGTGGQGLPTSWRNHLR